MNLKNTEISKFIKDYFLDENGVVYSSIDRETEGIVTDKTVEGGQTPDWYKEYTLAEFWQYENSGMTTGAYMNALCLSGSAEERRHTYNALKWIYDTGKQLEEGFIPKPYGGRFSKQTSTDQVLYVMSGLDAYYPWASLEEKREIEHMIPMMAHFWMNRGYKYQYYHINDMIWPPLRFPSFLMAAYHYSRDEIFKREADHILRENLDFFPENSKIFVRKELSDFERKNKVRIINQMADAVTMDVMNLEMLMRFEPESEFAQIWLKGIETIWNEAKLTLRSDGKYDTILFYDMDKKTTRPPDSGDCQWQGTKSGWSTMVVRAGLMAEKYLPGQRNEIRAAACNVLSKLGPRDCTYYEDAENFPPEMRFKTRFLSGDSIVNWLWAYNLYQASNRFPTADGKNRMEGTKSEPLSHQPNWINPEVQTGQFVMNLNQSLAAGCFIDDAGLAPALPPSWKTPETSREPVIRNEFQDPERLLETAVGSLRKFMLAAIPFEFPVILRKMNGEGERESFELDLNVRSAEIRAFDTEGIRRGIYALIREWKKNGSPEFPSRKIRRAPWLKTRIARCCFGPIKRPPLNRDELMDDVNYYPDSYLECLASEGINALWLTVSFADLCTTRFTPGDGKEKVRRYAKLQQTVDRCRRYGIRIYIFGIEPNSWESDSSVLNQFPSLGGPAIFGRRCFCPNSPEGKEYLYACMNGIFSSVKGLGGMINISIGEGITTCLGSMNMDKDSDIQQCPRRCSLNPGEIMAAALEAMNRGMKDASPESELIAWFYIPFIRKLPDTLKTLAEKAPAEVILQLNFESGAAVEQLGKKRVVGDYWQFIPEPSDVFDEFARLAKKSGRKISAKIQVGCSHEIATVPHVPVPGLLYRKFAAMRRRGIAHAMLGWYFGTTPGLMNKAAGELAFLETESVPEKQFLFGFARLIWGKEHAPQAAEGWEIFSEACRNYPLSNMIQYFGPAADGVAWSLYLYPHDAKLLPTWLLNDGNTSGDNLCECLENHTIDEAATLFGRLAEEWERGVRIFVPMRDAFRDSPERLRDIGIAEALGIHFTTAADILRFYRFRRQFFLSGNPSLLDEMKKIVGKEIEARRKLLSLMKQDPRLGFHPEAEDYKYTSAGVERSIAQLRDLLDNEFSRPAEEILEKEKKIPRGKKSYLLGGRPCKCADFTWSAEIRDGRLHLHVLCPGRNPVMDEFYIGLDDMGGSFPWLMHTGVSGQIFHIPPDSECCVDSGKAGWEIHVTIPEQALPGSSFRNLRINLIRAIGSYANLSSWPLERTGSAPRLNLIFYDPANMGILSMPSENGTVT